MKIWTNRFIGVIAVGGGWYAIVLILAMFRDPEFSVGDKFFFIVFSALYIWGILCGIYMISNHKNGIRYSKYFYAIQIPALMTKVVGYSFFSGMYLSVTYSLNFQSITAKFSLGSIFQYNLFASRSEYYFGLNIIPIIILIYLFMLSRSAK